MTGIRVRAKIGDRNVVLDLEAPAERTTVVLGPNGAGKSTLIGLLSGALAPDVGTVEILGGTVADGRRVVPPHRRNVALLEQRALLFPHMDVLANAAFGLRARGVRRPAAEATARAHLAEVGCRDLASRRSDELSGGQAQRVALARALAIDPDVVLLDEPLAALDATAAPAMRRLLREHLRGRTAVLVTHDLLDVLTLGQHVVVLEGGRVSESGAAAHVLTRPRSAFLAEFAGLNLLSGHLTDAGLRLPGGPTVIGIPDRDAPCGPGWAAIPANAVSLHTAVPDGSPRNRLPVVVTAVEPRGAVVRVVTEVAGQRLAADLTAGAVADLALEPGARLVAAVKATAVALY